MCLDTGCFFKELAIAYARFWAYVSCKCKFLTV